LVVHGGHSPVEVSSNGNCVGNQVSRTIEKDAKTKSSKRGGLPYPASDSMRDGFPSRRVPWLPFRKEGTGAVTAAP
jgi:hypothetical protein